MHVGNDGFVFVASRLFSLTAKKELNDKEANDLITYLDGTNYWKDSGFEGKSNDSQAPNKIAILRARKERSKLSQAKSALVELLLS